MTEKERLEALDLEFASYREQTEAKHRRMRNVVNEIHKLVCTGTDCLVCKAIDE